jgi:DNA-directed RNA polymerase specialized sigma24 family protein
LIATFEGCANERKRVASVLLKRNAATDASPRPHMKNDPEKFARETRWLVEAKSGGDRGKAAMDQIFLAYQRVLLRYLRYCGLSSENALEASFRIWKEIAKKVDTFVPGDIPSAWIWKFVRFRMIDLWRIQKREPPTKSDSDEAVAREVEVAFTSLSPPSPERLRAVSDFERCVQKALADLKVTHAKEAQLLYAVYFLGWTMKVAARSRRSSVQAAGQFLHIARGHLKPLIEKCRDLRLDPPGGIRGKPPTQG